MTDAQSTEPVQQITIELVEGDEDGLLWAWNAFGEDKLLYHGAGKSLSICLDSMLDFLREEGVAP